MNFTKIKCRKCNNIHHVCDEEIIEASETFVGKKRNWVCSCGASMQQQGDRLLADVQLRRVVHR